MTEQTTLRARALHGDQLVGCMLSSDSPWLVEMAALAGFDFATLDLEHEPIDSASAATFVRACEAAGIPPIVRVPLGHRIQPLLNLGVAGIHVPDVNSAEAARELVTETRYHPIGRRSFAATVRSADYGLGQAAKAHFQRANEDLFVIAMIEDRAALAEIDEILSVTGIDAVHVGPGDLAQSMGFPVQAEVDEVANEIVRRVVSAGLVASLGTVGGNSSVIAQQRAIGVTLFTVVLNRIIARNLVDVRSAIHSALVS